MAGGVLPVAKHIPGHGRAGVDSHLSLPVVDVPRAALEATDFPPFAALAGLPLGMTAHVVYRAIDQDRPGTLSPVVVEEIIRGRIGFTGCLMTDDISMQALAGSLGDRSRAALDAGVDLVLHCSGRLDEMKQVAAACRPLKGAAAMRAQAALDARRRPEPIDLAAARDELADLMAAAVV